MATNNDFCKFIKQAYYNTTRTYFTKIIGENQRFEAFRKTYISDNEYAIFGRIVSYTLCSEHSSPIRLIAVGTLSCDRPHQRHTYASAAQYNSFKVRFFMSDILKKVFSSNELNELKIMSSLPILDVEQLSQDLHCNLESPQFKQMPEGLKKRDISGIWIQNDVQIYFFVSSEDDLKNFLMRDVEQYIRGAILFPNQEKMWKAGIEDHEFRLPYPSTFVCAVAQKWLISTLNPRFPRFNVTHEVKLYSQLVWRYIKKEKSKKSHPAHKYLGIYDAIKDFPVVTVEYTGKRDLPKTAKIETAAFRELIIVGKDVILRLCPNAKCETFEPIAPYYKVSDDNRMWLSDSDVSFARKMMWKMVGCYAAMPYKKINSIMFNGTILWKPTE